MDGWIAGRGCSAGLTYLYYAFDSLSGLIGWNDRLSPAPPLYPAFDQNSGPESSSHLAGSRNKHIYSSLDGR